MNLSIVIPLLNEQESLPELHQWIVKVMQSHNYSYEILFIDDGSTDASWQTISQLSSENPNVKGIRFLRNYGKSQALHAGFGKIGEKIVIHQARKYGNSKFGMSRFINGFLDLITIWFLSTFGKRPMHLFGLLGSIMFVIGFLFAFYLGIDKLFINTSGRLITERPQFYLSLTAMLIGTQLFLAGFLGEIILRTKNNEERYKISEELGVES